MITFSPLGLSKINFLVFLWPNWSTPQGGGEPKIVLSMGLETPRSLIWIRPWGFGGGLISEHAALGLFWLRVAGWVSMLGMACAQDHET